MTPDQIEALQNDIREIKQAVIGDPKLGLNGLVNDMSEMKSWRNSITIKVAVVSGIVSGSVVGAKTLLSKFFSGS